jgi:tape measure domain-containing protein
MQVTDELRVLVEAEVARASENVKKRGSSIDGAGQKTESLGDALDSISKKSLILSGVISGAGIAAVKFAGENEKLKLSLKNMLGSAEEASAVFEDWRRLGTSPGLSVDEVFEVGRAMVNMGHDTAYATQTIQMLGDVAAGTGSSFGAISGSFEHIRATGKLTTRDLASLQQQGIPVLKQLAKELGTSEDGVRRLAAEGKLGFSDLERALKGMTSPGGQFAGMMNELAGTTLEKFNTAMDDAKQALASFGELMLPMATELLDGVSSILRGINDMDDGTKRFVIGMGGVVAVSGPAIAAIRAIHAAMTAAMANPYMLAIGAGIAAVAIVAGLINKQANAYEDLNTEIRKTKNEADDLLRSYAGGNEAKILDKQTTEELIRLYPELTGKITAYTITVEEAARAVAELAYEQRKDLEFKIRAPEIERLQGELAKLNMAISDVQTSIAEGYSSGEALEQLKRELAEMEEQQREYFKRISALHRETLDAVADPPAVVLPAIMPDIGSTEKLKKNWQDWYGEITKIDPEQFGDSGAKAAELYLAEFSRSFEAGKTIFAELGEEFDIAEALRSQQADIQKALVELFSINPADIDAQFTTVGEAIEPLIKEYKRLKEAMEAAAGQTEAEQTIESLRKKIDDLGKSESQLAYDVALTNKALPEQAEKIRELTDEYRRAEILAEYQRQIDEIGKSQNELAIAAYAATGATEVEMAALIATLDLRDELLQTQELEKTLEGIKESLTNLAAGAALGGIEELGRALGQGKEAGEAMQDALTAMSQEILNALPNLFLQAGLQLISQGQWPLGLGFIAAAGSTALIKGYVGGRIEAEQAAAQANAHGNVFDAAGIQAFARGGTFTNQVVQSPTLFKFARGTGIMGEAGPEAILPLKRMVSGNLGVETSGGGTQVTVNIINSTGAEVRQEESDDGMGGKQIDVIIGEAVNRHLISGKADRALGGRYGLRAAGV